MALLLSSGQRSFIQADIKSDKESFDIALPLEEHLDKVSPTIPSMDCVSFTSSFYPHDFPTIESQGQRRSSIASCSSSTPPELFFTPSVGHTSPTTPLIAESNMHTAYKPLKKPAGNDTFQSLFQLTEEDDNLNRCLWLDHTSTTDGFPLGLPLLPQVPDMFPMGGISPFYGAENQSLGTLAPSPALTKPMFSNAGGYSSADLSVEEILPWNAHRSHQPETIEPSVIVQHTLSSSAGVKAEPTTPLHLHMPGPAILSSSSPLSILSPIMVPSQRDVKELPYDAVDLGLRFSSPAKHKIPSDRLFRRGYERKRLSGASARPKAMAVAGKSGIDCELVIAQNEYACNYPGCIDKNTGKQKKFRRQEHRKRHETTVHEKSTAFQCWVPDCKRAFSRTDNLKSHLRNTHSKKPGVRGNRYVATLDKNNEYYDPEWVGDLDKQGYPIL